MKIVALEAFQFHRQLDGRHWNPATRWSERLAPLIRITTSDGRRGIGEAWCQQAEIGTVFDRLRALRPYLVGRDPLAIAEVRGDFGEAATWVDAGAFAAIDIAMWDLRAQYEDSALFSLLDPIGRVRVYASGGLYADDKDPAALAQEMRDYAARGFTAVKMKLGGLGLEADMVRVAAVRAAIGDAVLLVDAVGQLDRESAPRWMARLADFGVTHIQSPLPAADLAGIAALNRAGPLRVIAGEAAFRRDELRMLAASVDWVQPNAGLLGISGVLELLGVARCSLQCHATAVLQAASLHLGTVSGLPTEFHMFHDHLHGAMPDAMRHVADGTVSLDATPGLGIAADLLDTDPNITRIF